MSCPTWNPASKISGDEAARFTSLSFIGPTPEEIILTAIKKQSEASDKYSELGIKIYELSQKGLEVYEKKKLPLEKRRLFNLAFDKLSLEGDRLILNYSKAFEVLFDAVSATNSSKVPNLAKLPTNIFELRDSKHKTTKNRAFDPAFDAMLRW